MKKSLFVAPAITAVLITGTAMAAPAAVTGGAALAAFTRAMPGPSAAATGLTFTLTAGLLTVSAPLSATLGPAALDGTVTDLTGPLGDVIVSDQRAAPSGHWIASVVSTDFTGTNTGAIIPAGDVNYTPGASVSSSGTGTFTPGSKGALDNSTPLTAYTAAGETGVTSVTWDPTIDIPILPSFTADTYTGTITHSVA